MSSTVTITPDLTHLMHSLKILLKYNCPPPSAGVYGWIKEGQDVVLHNDVVLEQNVGLYGGRYVPLVGGRRSSGFASVGSFSYSYSALPDGIMVGRYCSISSGLKFIDSSHPVDLITTSAITFRPRNSLFKDFITPSLIEYAESYSTTSNYYPTIGHDVWIGANVTLGMGIKIGTGAIIATNATVTKDVPPYSIVVGNSGRIVKSRFSEDVVERLVRSEWWSYCPKQVFSNIRQSPVSLVDRIERQELDRFKFHNVHLNGFAVKGV